jgi:hypothetical protein
MKALERRIKANRLGEIHIGLYPETLWLLKPGEHKISKETADHFCIPASTKKYTYAGRSLHEYSGFSEVLNGIYASWRTSEMMSSFYGRKVQVWSSVPLDPVAFGKIPSFQCFSPRKTIAAVKFFAERGWLDMQKGKVVTGMCTRFVPTQKLIDLFRTCPEFKSSFRKSGRDTNKVYTRIRASKAQDRFVESDDVLAFPEIKLVSEHRARCKANKITFGRRKRVGKFILPINQSLRVSTFLRLRAETNQVILNPDMVQKRKVFAKSENLYLNLKAVPSSKSWLDGPVSDTSDTSSKGREEEVHALTKHTSNPLNISSYFGISKALHQDLVEVAKTLIDKTLRDKMQIAEDKSIDPGLFEVIRMFQAAEGEEPFEAGGRLVSYSHGLFTKAERQRIRVNGFPTAEVDVNACQPRLLFSLIGQSLDESFYETIFPENRDLAKSLIMYFVGSKKPTHHGWLRSRAALRAQYDNISKDEWNRIIALLDPVEHLLQSAWRKLQRAESDWLIEVMTRYYNRFSDDVLLSWHDSIRVREDRVDALKEIMMEVWQEMFQTACILKVTPALKERTKNKVEKTHDKGARKPQERAQRPAAPTPPEQVSSRSQSLSGAFSVSIPAAPNEGDQQTTNGQKTAPKEPCVPPTAKPPDRIYQESLPASLSL